MRQPIKLNSGIPNLEALYHSTSLSAKRAYRVKTQWEVVAKIGEMITRFPAQKANIVGTLILELESYINYNKDWDKADEHDIGLQLLKGYLQGSKNILEWLQNGMGDFLKIKLENRFSHREIIIAHDYKVKARLAKPFSNAELKAVSAKRYQASLGLVPSKNKPPRIEELQAVVKLLIKFPKAQELAKIDLERLESLL